MRHLFFEVSFGASKRVVSFSFTPFQWMLSLLLRPRVIVDVGPLRLLIKRTAALIALILIMGSIAQAAPPYYHGTPPNAIYRQPIQVPIYQPGVRIYYRSQHVPVPGFGTIITNEYRYAPSYRRGQQPTNLPQSSPYRRNSTSTRSGVRPSYGYNPYSR